jgi:hypothetical protein
LFGSLDRLGPLERAVLHATGAERERAWMAWTAAVQRMFERADECWFELRAVLVESRRAAPRGRWGRRR